MTKNLKFKHLFVFLFCTLTLSCGTEEKTTNKSGTSSLDSIKELENQTKDWWNQGAKSETKKEDSKEKYPAKEDVKKEEPKKDDGQGADSDPIAKWTGTLELKLGTGYLKFFLKKAKTCDLNYGIKLEDSKVEKCKDCKLVQKLVFHKFSAAKDSELCKEAKDLLGTSMVLGYKEIKSKSEKAKLQIFKDGKWSEYSSSYSALKNDIWHVGWDLN